MKPLFDLPEYDDSFDRFVHRAINELIHRKDPILREIPARFSDEINTTQNTMPSGEVVENKPFGFRMPFGVEFDEVIEGQSAKLLKAINDAAEEGLKVLMPQFFDQLTRVSTAAGTAVDAQGVPLSWTLILQSWEKIEIDFDENGKPKLGMVVAPETYKQLMNLPFTEKDHLALNDLLKRKKLEFNARQRSRKLS
jgi:hypothetical protein